jgi:hypothetical protein
MSPCAGWQSSGHSSIESTPAGTPGGAVFADSAVVMVVQQQQQQQPAQPMMRLPMAPLPPRSTFGPRVSAPVFVTGTSAGVATNPLMRQPAFAPTAMQTPPPSPAMRFSPAATVCPTPTASAPLERTRLLENMLDREEEFMPTSEFLHRVQRSAVTPEMRRDTLLMLRRVSVHLCSHMDTFAHAVQLFDRFLSKVRVRDSHLRLIAATAFLVASKLDEVWNQHAPPKDLCVAMGGEFTANDIVRMEKIMLNKLEWQVSSISSHAFLHQVTLALVHAGANADFVRSSLVARAERFIDSALCLYDFACFRPSTIAVASLSCTFALMGRPMWAQVYDLCDCSAYDQDIECCSQMMRVMLADLFTPTSPF